MRPDLVWHARQQIARNRRNPLVRGVAAIAEFYLRAYHNEGNPNFDHNGERFLMERLGHRMGDRALTIWDVGAHEGEWSQLAHGYLPQAHILSFEVVPSVFRRIPPQPWREAHNIGLSDQDGHVGVTVAEGWDTASAIEPRRGHRFFEDGRVEHCTVARGDTLIANGRPRPDFLKIDTEGHEVPVLRGLTGLLASAPPEIIQLEYGQTYIPGGYSLRNLFDLLAPHGYRIGRLHPGHVDYFDYGYHRDDFRMSNLVAVRSDELVALTAPRR